jgi:hypothetical protein
MEGDDMTQEQRGTARREEILQAAARVGTRQHRLEWAVRFAQEDVGALSPGQRLDRRLEVLAFLMLSSGIGGHPEAIALPTDAEMQTIQQDFTRIIDATLHQQRIDLGQHNVSTQLIWMPGPRGIRPKPRYVEIPEPGMEPRETYYARRGMARLVAEMYDEGRRIKVCDAPKPRTRAAERCGRRFVGRPNQTYCSPACRNLANTRATRAKRQQKRRRRTSGKE